MGERKRGERGEKASAVKKGMGRKEKDSRGRKGKKGEMTDRSGETKAKRSFGKRAAKEGGVPRKSLAGVLTALLCALCFSVPLSGQALRVDTALVRMARGEVQEYVIPQMASLEQPGIVRSGYRTVYPSGWTLGKASLSDGEGLINFFVIRLQGPAQKAQTADTFYDEKTHRGIAEGYGGQYLGSEYFRTRAGKEAVRIVSFRSGMQGGEYVWVYFVRLSSGLTLSSTGIAPGLPPRDGTLPQKAVRYQALFDAMIREVDRR